MYLLYSFRYHLENEDTRNRSVFRYQFNGSKVVHNSSGSELIGRMLYWGSYSQELIYGYMPFA